MLNQMVASKAAKIIATCVCPVAGTTALTLGVPQVRSAVHRATQPRAVALPRTRTREPVQLAQAVPCIPNVTMAGTLPGVDALNFPVVQSLAPLSNSPRVLASAPPVRFGPGIFPVGGGGGGFNGPTPGPDGMVPIVPEPDTWVHLVLGFAIVGGAARAKARKSADASAGGDGSERPLA